MARNLEKSDLLFRSLGVTIYRAGYAFQLKCVDLNPNSKEICANFLLTLFVANNAYYLIGLAFYKGNNQKQYFVFAQSQGQSVPDCMY